MPDAVPIEPLPVGDPPLVGEVVDFDEPRGLGTVRVGEREAGFHCTAITDGSRNIEVGTVVAVRLHAGRLGRIEARWVRPLPGVTSRGASLGGGGRSSSGQPVSGLAVGPPPAESGARSGRPRGSDTPPSGIPPVTGPSSGA